MLVAVVGCSASDPFSRGLKSEEFAVADEFLGADHWEVALCRIPDDVEDSTYEVSAERLAVDVETIVDRLVGVSEYFSRWSHGRYSLEWSSAADVAITASETSYDCVDRALDQSRADSSGVLVIADSQHAVDAPGGWGRRGERCDRPCAARESRRAAYVGASDFVSYWGDESPLDLIEHEVGHALGWPHSATAAGVGESHVYDSDVDLMSNSAAPRDLDPTRRHGPGVLAFNAWLAGWLDDSEIIFMELADTQSGDWQDAIRLVTTDSPPNESNVRLVMIDLGSTLLSVEAVADRGDNDHRRESGVALHEIVFDADAPEGRWHVVQPAESDRSLVLGSGNEWTSATGEVSIRVGRFTAVDGELSVDLRIRKNVVVPERVSAGN